MSSIKILIVEDEETLREVLRYNLETEGYIVVTASDGVSAIRLAKSERPDVLILDIMLPEIDGYEVCRTLRKDMIVPILMLTAKDEEIDKVLGLELGADDYMTKPFSMRELKARVKAMLRRREMMQPASTGTESPVITAGDLTIDLGSRTVSLGTTKLSLKPKEFDLLAFLARNRDHVFTRDQLLERVWGYDYAGGTRTVDVHVRWLREKIEDEPSRPARIITIRGIGYKLEA